VNNAYKASQLLQEAGFKAYVVGGAVRDSIMGQEPKDWDLATNATPLDVTEVFNLAETKVIPTGIEYGTVTVLMPIPQKGFDFTDLRSEEDFLEHIEITTFRADQSYSDGRRPDAVTFSKTIEEDLSRRDFTCNAIAWDIVNGVFIDPYDGQTDIANNVLRCVGDPFVRFGEDGLRLMRAVRFGCTKNFIMDDDLMFGAIHCSDNIKSVSNERVRDELLKILTSPSPTLGLTTLLSLRLLKHICPELLKQVGMEQNSYHAHNVWMHTLHCVHQCESNDPIMRLAVLLHDIGKPETRKPHPKRPGEYQFLKHEEVGAEMVEAWMREYKFSNEDIARVRHIILHHLIMYTPKWSNAAVRRWVQRVGKENIPDLICMARCDLLGKGLPVAEKMATLQELLDRIDNMPEPIVEKTNQLAINGNDVMACYGEIEGGKWVGDVLKDLLEVVTEDPTLNNRDALTHMMLCNSGFRVEEGI